MKKFIIAKQGCEEFSNRLIAYLSVYAYGLFENAETLNPSFYEHHYFFSLRSRESLFIRILSILAARRHEANLWHRLVRIVYALYSRFVGKWYAHNAHQGWRGYVYVPPTRCFEDTDAQKNYFFGWLFRNPKGLTKYRAELRKVFTPSHTYLRRMERVYASFGEKIVIGVHLRQTPFKGFPQGEFLIPVVRTEEIVQEYLGAQGYTNDQVVLLIVCDRPLPENAFHGYSTYVSSEDDATNLFLLSKAQVVIATNSTFGNLAAWFGDIPHIVTTTNPVDWIYYRDHTSYFDNKYATFANS